MFQLLIIFLVINIKKKPFNFVALNDIETMSIITSMISMYCGIFYLSDMPGIYESDDPTIKALDNGLSLSEEVKFIFFLVILASNLVFFIYWAFKMF